MKIIREFENLETTNPTLVTLEDLFDSLIHQYYSENKVNSTASSMKEDV